MAAFFLSFLGCTSIPPPTHPTPLVWVFPFICAYCPHSAQFWLHSQQLLPSAGLVIEGSLDFTAAPQSLFLQAPCTHFLWTRAKPPVSVTVLKLVLHIFQWDLSTVLWFLCSQAISQKPHCFLFFLLHRWATIQVLWVLVCLHPFILWGSSSFVINVFHWFLVSISCPIFMCWFGEIENYACQIVFPGEPTK